MREEHGIATGTPEGIDSWWDKNDDLEVDGKLVLLYNTFAREENAEFFGVLSLFEVVDSAFNELAEKGRIEDGIKLLEKLKEQRPAQYMADYQYYDYYLLHYYAPLGEKERLQEIIKHFAEEPEQGIDHITVALDIFRLYGMAGEILQLSRIAYQKLKKSDENMSWGLDDLEQRAIFCVI